MKKLFFCPAGGVPARVAAVATNRARRGSKQLEVALAGYSLSKQMPVRNRVRPSYSATPE